MTNSSNPSDAVTAPPSDEEIAAGMRRYVAYAPDTGRVIASAYCPADLMHTLHPGAGLLLDDQLDPLTEYVDPVTKQPRARPVLILVASRNRIKADGADETTITGIPAGAIIIVRGETFEADGAAVTYSTTQPGQHALRVLAFPYQDATVTIHAD
ncbi:hypothetical protein D9623_26480 (plasmid) [Azospirillum brasilense]|uniref:Uncharacterized protein n=1 Tax=Azospirillum brasilense TaxID=192 RepID=A0A4D8QT19_AZOBR|nr:MULTISPECIES: hypothetical protein [Azospirillum]MDW7556783.1 hypothetical protein [Azospirillum brasilense]MDW7594099.1 hypothetical protein [Azospirillum brasilense]MDW7632672.1 hypothetical protein [Azospirillum brasilense]MDX5949931.1 hypothetical protein [Azospirillum brasilense]OPH13814.1 hypothetical protein FE89_19700 [Azospirillum brasilense]